MTPLDCPTLKIQGSCKQHAVIVYADRIILLWTLHWL